MDRPSDEHHDADESEDVEDWLAEHRKLYETDDNTDAGRSKKRKRRKSKSKSKRKNKKRSSKPGRKTIKVRSNNRRPCPSCKQEALTDTIKGGMCLGCQVAVFLDIETSGAQ